MDLNPIFILVVCFLVFLIAYFLEAKPQYRYSKKDSTMTLTEKECFTILVELFGERFYVFPQVHLDALLDHKVIGQTNWFGAWRHINQKSVDFVLVNKGGLYSELAIELDDRSHEQEKRKVRDREVNNMFEQAKVRLLRIKPEDLQNHEELKRKIEEGLVQVLPDGLILEKELKYEKRLIKLATILGIVVTIYLIYIFFG